MEKFNSNDVVTRLWLIGKKVGGLGELMKFRTDDSQENANFAIGEILEELGDEIIEIKDRIEGTHRTVK